MKKIDIFGLGIKAAATTITAQRRVNCYYDVRVDSEKNAIVIQPSPGLTRFVTFPTAPIRGFWTDGPYVYTVAGNVLYVITFDGYVTISTFGPFANPYTPVSMSTNETQLMIVDGVGLYIFDITSISNILATPGQTLSQLAPLQSLITQF